MDEKRFLNRAGRKSTYFLMLAALAVVAAAGFLMLPDSRTVSAQEADTKTDSRGETKEVVTQAMIDFALNLHTASEYTVYAERGVSQKGSSIKGEIGDARRDAAGRKATKELSNSIDAIRQLPCNEVKSSDLGRSFTPGVYCLDSAELAGEMVLTGGNAASTYIFRVAGSLNAKSGSSIRLENGAQAGNVYFVADEATVAGDSTFRANILTTKKADIAGTVTGKVLSLGEVSMDMAHVAGGGTGTMEICKVQQTPFLPANDLSNNRFRFTVTGAVNQGTAANPVVVSVGQCSAPFDVTAGAQVVTELDSGPTISGTPATWSGNFELTNVRNLTPGSTSSLGLVNLLTRTANVNIVEGGISTQLTLEFTNRKTITGYVEICKQAAQGPGPFNPAAAPQPFGGGDPDVTGFFEFTLGRQYTTNTLNPLDRVLQVFTIPVGQCTGPIAVKIGDPPPGSLPPPATASGLWVTEIGRPGFYAESIAVFPAANNIGPEFYGIGNGPFGGDALDGFLNPGGAVIGVRVVESSTSASETLVTFRNRSNPGVVKVCKIAGPGVPLNSLFRFTVTAPWGAQVATVPQPNVGIFPPPPPSQVYGPVAVSFDVRAGDPAQGGQCVIVPGLGSSGNTPNTYDEFQTYMNGTPVTVIEEGVSPNNTITFPASSDPDYTLFTSRILTSSVFVPTSQAGFTPNPDLGIAALSGPQTINRTPGSRVSRAAVRARASLVEVEFVNIRVRRAVLKVCKIAGPGLATGGAFNFDVTVVSPVSQPGNVPLFPGNMTSSVTTTAGDAAQGGNCAFATGPSLFGGLFPVGIRTTVTETTGGTNVTAITSSSAPSGCFTADLPGKTGTFLAPGSGSCSGAASNPGGITVGINAVTFTNVPGATPFSAARIDYDGDKKADPSVFTPSTAKWTWAASSEAGMNKANNFGVASDKLVPADYDGDGKTDLAVYRASTGYWYFLGTTGVFEAHQWGQAGDIPQAGDYDGDGKADFVVYRPGDGTWYEKRSRDGFNFVQFGQQNDKPYAADYDGDGMTDIGVYRVDTWYTLGSTKGFRATQFGAAGDIPVPADYDGDGAADLAVYRAGTWYVLTATTFSSYQYGLATDIPVPDDYDGDGKTDLAVYRASEGKWYVSKTGGSANATPDSFTLGGNGDVPVPAGN